MQSKEELLEIERFEQYQREVATNTYSFDRVFARGLSKERVRRAREAALQRISAPGGSGGGGKAPRDLIRPTDGKHNGV